MSYSRSLRSVTPNEKQSLIANGERSVSDNTTVEKLRVEVSRYAVGEEFNDEGPILFFEVGENELLLLWGQWLYDPHVVTSHLLDLDEIWERNAWFKHFEVVRSPSSGIVLSLKSIGRETVNSAGIVSAGQRLPPQPSAVIPGNLEMLLGDASRA